MSAYSKGNHANGSKEFCPKATAAWFIDVFLVHFEIFGWMIGFGGVAVLLFYMSQLGQLSFVK